MKRLAVPVVDKDTHLSMETQTQKGQTREAACSACYPFSTGQWPSIFTVESHYGVDV